MRFPCTVLSPPIDSIADRTPGPASDSADFATTTPWIVRDDPRWATEPTEIPSSTVAAEPSEKAESTMSCPAVDKAPLHLV